MDDKKSLALRGVLAGAVAALIACGLYMSGVFESLEYQLYDRDFRMSAPRATPEEIVIDARDGASRSRWLAHAMGELSPREQMIIRSRRLAEEGATLEELGRRLGVSKERVRQLEHRALIKLRTVIERFVDPSRPRRGVRVRQL